MSVSEIGDVKEVKVSQRVSTDKLQASVWRDVRNTEKPFATSSLAAIGEALISGRLRAERGNEVIELPPVPCPQQKNALPAATFSGVFTRRDSQHYTTLTGAVALDYDNVGGEKLTQQQRDTLTAEEVTKREVDQLRNAALLRDKAASHSSCALAYITPSGEGIRVVAVCEPAVDGDDHKNMVRQVAVFYNAMLGVEHDSVAVDVARLAFLCQDEGAYVAEGVTPLVRASLSAPKQSVSYAPVERNAPRHSSVLDEIGRDDLYSLLRLTGGNRMAKAIRVSCPMPNHTDRDPSALIYGDRGDAHLHCYGCGEHHFTIQAMVATGVAVDARDAYAQVRKHLNIPSPQSKLHPLDPLKRNGTVNGVAAVAQPSRSMLAINGNDLGVISTRLDGASTNDSPQHVVESLSDLTVINWRGRLVERWKGEDTKISLPPHFAASGTRWWEWVRGNWKERDESTMERECVELLGADPSRPPDYPTVETIPARIVTETLEQSKQQLCPPGFLMREPENDQSASWVRETGEHVPGVRWDDAIISIDHGGELSFTSDGKHIFSPTTKLPWRAEGIKPLLEREVTLTDLPDRTSAFISHWGLDDESATHLMAQVGRTIMSDTSPQTMCALHGVAASGKSSFLSLLNGLCGGAMASMSSPIDLGSRFAGSELQGKRALLLPDLPSMGSREKGAQAGLAVMKSIIGEDEIRVEQKYKRAVVSVRMPIVVWIATNIMPSFTSRIEDADAWIRRITPFSLTRTVPLEKRNPELVPEILDKEGEKVAQVCVALWVQHLREGRKIPASVLALRTKIVDKGLSPPNRYVRDRIDADTDEEAFIFNSDLDADIKDWSEGEGMRDDDALKRKPVSDIIKKSYGSEAGRRRKGGQIERGWSGVKFKTPPPSAVEDDPFG